TAFAFLPSPTIFSSIQALRSSVEEAEMKAEKEQGKDSPETEDAKMVT
ncbi:hypothetical protein A2U01_0111510, partial [Trifolium medium]|nr:hypothetical protein [Trifolium medium]